MKRIDMNKKKKRESLLDSAFSLFINNGFHKTSISDIVEAAGVAKGTFYLYFLQIRYPEPSDLAQGQPGISQRLPQPDRQRHNGFRGTGYLLYRPYPQSVFGRPSAGAAFVQTSELGHVQKFSVRSGTQGLRKHSGHFP